MKKWICLCLGLLVFVGFTGMAFFLPEEVFTRSIIGFSLICLIETIRSEK